MKLKTIICNLLALCVIYCQCYAADVLIVDVSRTPLAVEQKLQLACEFYGLDTDRLVLRESENGRLLADAFQKRDVQAIVILSRSLSILNKQELFSILKGKRGNKAPLLILGLAASMDPSLLGEWSSGTILGCANSSGVPLSGFYTVSALKSIARQLGGLDIPVACKNLDYFLIDNTGGVQSIIQVGKVKKETLFPIFIKTMVDGQEVFFLTKTEFSELSKESPLRFFRAGFLEIAPLMMFLRYACGERCWHSPGHYANLTIDDPWLTEPYGHLSYKGLFKEMEKTDFHTTIAFIPWNYDRNKPQVAALFREHPNRFSICIHGNNHNHQEFYRYERNRGDPLPVESLNEHEVKIKQAIARMEKFRELTGIDYDRVMVFPHAIAPAKTLTLLKKYNFSGTFNVNNVPMGSAEPADALFCFRAVSLDFENFPSVKRHSANRSKPEIAIDLFLDKPILLYAHHDFFKNGIDAFNETAKVINDIQADIKWGSLGEVAQHLYLQKLRDDGDYDILAFSANLVIENTQQRDVTFFVRKEESFSIPIKHVTVNGQPQPYVTSGSELSCRINIPSGEYRHIMIEYDNDLDLASIDVAKKDRVVNLLRKLSDFRDLTLSKYVFGSALIHFYYYTTIYGLGLMGASILLLVLTFFTVAVVLYLKKRLNNR
jgi:hypothetical protein